jgi:hypothetical protein
MRRAGWSLVFGCILLLLAACGYAPTGQGPGTQTASSAQTGSPTPIASSSPLPSGSPWSSKYSDTTYQFGFSYPPGFTVELHPSDGRTGLLVSYRAVDTTHLKGYPPGQLELAVYAKDSTTLGEWVTKHSGPSGSPDITRHWTPVTNRNATTVGGSPALSFDWIPDMLDKTVHATIVFLGTDYVLLVQWWSTNSTYAPTLQQHYAQMLTTVQI